MLVGSAFGKVSLDVSGVVTGVQQAANVLKNLKSTMELAGGGIKKLEANLNTAKTALAAARGEFEKLKQSGAAKDQIKAAADNLKKLEQEAENAAGALNKAQAQLQQLGQVGQQVGGALQNIGSTLTMTVSLPLVAAGAAAIKFASSMAETRSKTKVIFGDMSDDMLQWAKTANTALKMTQQSALDAAADFALFGKAAGKSGQELNKFSKSNVELAADLASFFESSPEEAILAIGAAYRGESEPIRRYGVLLNEAAVKQKAMQMGLLNANGELSQQNRILAVNKLILEQTTAAQGDLARTGGSMSNQMKEAQATFHDVLVELGENLLPIALKVITELNKMLKAFQAMPEPMQNAVLALAGFAVVLGPLLSMLGTLITTISSLVTAWPAITAGVTALTPALASIGAVITGTVIPALGALIAAAAPVILPILLIIATLALLYAAFSTNAFGIRTTWDQLMFIIGFYAQQGWEAVSQAFADGWRNVTDWVQRTVESIQQFFNIDWSAVGYNIVAGIVDGLMSAWQWLVDTVTNLANAAYDAAKKALGIASPSKKFAYLGDMSGLGYAMAFAQAADPIEIARTIAQPVNNNTSSVRTFNQVNHFSSGLTTQRANRLIDQQIERRERKNLRLME